MCVPGRPDSSVTHNLSAIEGMWCAPDLERSGRVRTDDTVRGLYRTVGRVDPDGALPALVLVGRSVYPVGPSYPSQTPKGPSENRVVGKDGVTEPPRYEEPHSGTKFRVETAPDQGIEVRSVRTRLLRCYSLGQSS